MQKMFDRMTGDRDEMWFLIALRRRWWVIVLAAVIAGGCAYVLSSRQQKQYTSTSALVFSNSSIDQALVGTSFLSSADPTRAAATNLDLVRSPTVAQRVAGQLNLPLGRVLSDVNVGSDATSDVVPVAVTDPKPLLAARIANAYAQQYIEFRKAAEQQGWNVSLANVDSALAKAQPGSAEAQQLLKYRSTIEVLQGAQTGDASQVQYASVPTSPSSPKPKRDGILGLVLGLLVGGALVAALDRRDRRIKTVEQVESVYDSPVLGTIPESASLRGVGRLTPSEEEPFLMMRAQLRYFDVDRDVKRLLVTSAEAGEGKTTIALNLARAAARADGKRALLIESDLRRPTLTRMLGRGHAAGLSELLSNAQDISTSLQELVIGSDQLHLDDSGRTVSLDILMAGSTPPNPSELLESRRMVELLDAADSVYDIVIIDTAPIGAVSDAMPLVKEVDGVLVVSRLGFSHRDGAIRLMKWLRSLNAHLLGVVVNCADASASRYGYYGDYAAGEHEHSSRRRLARLKEGDPRSR